MAQADLSWIMPGATWRQLTYQERREHWIRLNAFFRSKSRREHHEDLDPAQDWINAEAEFNWAIRRNTHLLDA